MEGKEGLAKVENLPQAKRFPDTEPEKGPRQALGGGVRSSRQGRDRKLRFTALLHHQITTRNAFEGILSRMKKKPAPGVDGRTGGGLRRDGWRGKKSPGPLRMAEARKRTDVERRPGA